MKTPQRGEVSLVDLGMTAKVRPALVVSIPANDADRALVTLVPHTTSVRGSRFEAAVQVGFLKAGAFDAQSLVLDVSSAISSSQLQRFVASIAKRWRRARG